MLSTASLLQHHSKCTVSADSQGIEPVCLNLQHYHIDRSQETGQHRAAVFKPTFNRTMLFIMKLQTSSPQKSVQDRRGVMPGSLSTPAKARSPRQRSAQPTARPGARIRPSVCPCTLHFCSMSPYIHRQEARRFSTKPGGIKANLNSQEWLFNQLESIHNKLFKAVSVSWIPR